MLSAAKHLEAQRARPFAAAQGDTEGKYLRGSTVKLERSSSFEPCLNSVMRTAEHLARRAYPGEARVSWRGARILARRAYPGEARVSWRGARILVRRAYPGEARVSWRGARILVRRAYPGEARVSWRGARILARHAYPGEGKPRHYISGTSRLFDKRLPIVILC
jgi:hypothetical protein